jgi:hypothetical protein
MFILSYNDGIVLTVDHPLEDDYETAIFGLVQIIDITDVNAPLIWDKERWVPVMSAAEYRRINNV